MTGKGPCVAGSAFPSYCAAGDSARLLRTRRWSLPAGDARGMHGAEGGVTQGWGWGDRIRRRIERTGHLTRARGVVPEPGERDHPGPCIRGYMVVRDGDSPVSLGEAAHAVRADVDRPPAGTEARRYRRARPEQCRGDGEGRVDRNRSARADGVGWRNPRAPGCGAWSPVDGTEPGTIVGWRRAG